MGQFEDMNTFTRIVEAGSISRAAEQLGLAKSAVSRRLTDLEARLDVQLIHRTTRKSSLTQAGQSYYQRALQILGDVSELNAVTSNTKVVLKGDFKIAVPLSFGLHYLVSAITDFADRHPRLVMKIDFSDRQVDLIEDGFDLAVRIADLKDSTHIATKITTIRTLLCASPDYLDQRGRPAVPDDLVHHDILHYAINVNAPWKLISPNGFETSIRLPAKMSANNGEFLKEAAIAGHGIAKLPTFLAWQDIENGRLERVMGDHQFAPLNAYAVYPETRHLSVRVRTFIDFLKERFAGEPQWDKYI
jgi:DNA-binding transcriptional LysR family regulator